MNSLLDQDFSSRPKDRRKKRRARSKAGNTHWRQLMRQRWNRWLDRRLPPNREITLSQRSVFIFPTRAGFAYLGFTFILLLVGINFENSPVYALTFLLLGLFMVSILHTFGNLSGITVKIVHAEPAFAGQDASFHVVLSCRGARKYYGLKLNWRDNAPVWMSLSDQRESRVVLLYRTGQRGICQPGRMKIETTYPLGLFRAWTWLDLGGQTVVYPYPGNSLRVPKTTMLAHEKGDNEEFGSDDFFGLRDYVAGDTIKAIAWKNYAKTGTLNTKQFIDPVDHRLWLDWENTEGSDVEARLEQLCYWALEAEKGHNEYGLRLPDKVIQPGRHQAHLEKILRALALYDIPLEQWVEEGVDTGTGDAAVNSGLHQAAVS